MHYEIYQFLTREHPPATLTLRNVRDRDVHDLVASPRIAHLRLLDLQYNNLGRASGTALAASSHLSSLHFLALGHNGMGDEGAAALAGPSHLGHLRRLDLPFNHIGDAGAIALAESPYLANLQHLDLHVNWIGNDGAAALARSPHLAHLRILDLCSNPIDPEAHMQILRSPWLGRVEEFRLGHTDHRRVGRYLSAMRDVIEGRSDLPELVRKHPYELGLLSRLFLARGEVIPDLLFRAIETPVPDNAPFRPWLESQAENVPDDVVQKAVTYFPGNPVLRQRALRRDRVREVLESALF